MRFSNRLIQVMVLGAVASTIASAAPAENAKLRFPGDPVVVMDTDKGEITVEIFQKKAPITAGNFLDLVKRKFYDGLTFHRIVPGFVIQGGDPKGTGQGNFTDPKTGRDRTIKLEKVQGLNHDSAGTLAMARTSDPDSASCQFYITLAATTQLDDPPGYAVFGHVLSGMDAVNRISMGDHIKKAYIKQ